ncbi:uncharacterized protein LOC113505549 isoform X3 [Trichoplusia ni]|uniref:Uncharacterized protein LOC113505549 isoform X3 n=1 Tax=Trichoplusia ni TaxID=7111 RepID=A0A7E5WVD7_TRINI|nr:uncharacterized protein LOC113505549 isoform X3 [Trichoplusia ni]
MNSKNTHNSISNNRSLTEVSRKDAVTTTESRPIPDDEPTATNSTEDDAGIQFAPNKDFDYSGSDREPMFVIIDSSCVSNPSSKELLIDNRVNTNNTILKKHFNKSTKYVDVPSTSRDLRSDLLNQQLKEADSTDELLMMDINLQSDNELSVGDSDGDSDSIVLSYLRNKDAFLEMEGTIMSTKKKSSLLESVPKMETIIESEQFSTFPLVSRSEYKSDEILNNGDTTN